MIQPTIIKDKNNNEIAEWYNAPKGFIISFETLNPSQCKAILQLVLNELDSETKQGLAYADQDTMMPAT